MATYTVELMELDAGFSGNAVSCAGGEARRGALASISPAKPTPKMSNLQLVGTFATWDQRLLFDEPFLGRFWQIHTKGMFARSIAAGVEHISAQLDHGSGDYGDLELGRVASLTEDDHGAHAFIDLYCLPGPVLDRLERCHLGASFRTAAVEAGDVWEEPTVPTDLNPHCLPICRTFDTELLELGPCMYPKNRTCGFTLRRNSNARSESTRASRAAARAAYEDHQRHVAAFERILDQQRQTYVALVKELVRRAGGDRAKLLLALNFPANTLDSDKPKPARRSTTAVGKRHNFPEYPHVDHPAMVAWRERHGVSRADHIRLLERHGIGRSGVLRPTPDRSPCSSHRGMHRPKQHEPARNR